MADSPATKKVVILDCCFSGRALADLAGDEETIAGQVGIEGVYTLTATPRNAVALAPPGERYTAFTGALLDLLCGGIPGGPELLTFAAIFPRLKRTLISRQLPQPDQQNTGTIAHLALTRTPPTHRTTPPPQLENPRPNLRRSRLLARQAIALPLRSPTSPNAEPMRRRRRRSRSPMRHKAPRFSSGWPTKICAGLAMGRVPGWAPCPSHARPAKAPAKSPGAWVASHYLDVAGSARDEAWSPMTRARHARAAAG